MSAAADVERHDYAPGGRRGLCERCGHDRRHPWHEGGPSARPAPRPRLTSHQAEVLDRLRRHSRSGRRFVAGPGLPLAQRGWVPLWLVRSRGALDHLVDKGYAVRDSLAGPRGGAHWLYRPVRLPGECWCGADARPGWTTCTRHYSSGRAR